MRAALAFALRRTSARVVLAVGISGLLFVVYFALRPLRHYVYALCASSQCSPGVAFTGSSPWDLGVGAAAAVVAVIAAAVLYRRVSPRRSPAATDREARVTPIA